MSDLRRPALRYLGGKWRLAAKIAAFFPPHRLYVEPFGGAASVLLRKPRAYAEVYNDLDEDVVNLFRVLRDRPKAGELRRQLSLTPFARVEFEQSYAFTPEPVERARRLIVRSFMGHGNVSYRADRTTGFRCDSNRSGTTPAHDWRNYPEALDGLVERLTGVVIENRPAADVIRRFDRPDALFYADPPYVHSTRSEKRTRLAPSTGYVHEMDDQAHLELLEQLDRAVACVVLSGYAHPLYDHRLSHWRRIEIKAHADGARPRVEVLWINRAACDASGGLFGSDA